ncbi:MAG: EamA family transporter [Rhodospirillales bacterium]|nr:EamA family transporter [Rhodospirillales bacterium]
MSWLWIPLTVAAALLQNLRTAVQRSLVGRLSTNGAAMTRYIYGLPLALAYLLLLNGLGHAFPQPQLEFWVWVAAGSLAQTFATVLLLIVLKQRNFAVGIAYTKTEVVQAALFGSIFLGDRVSAPGAVAILLGTLGVMLFSLQENGRPWRAFLTGWFQQPAMLGMTSAGLFGVSAVSFRAASLSLEHPSVPMSAGYALFWSAVIQSAIIGAYLRLREPGQLTAVWRARKVAVLAGVTGISASACWFTAFTLQSVAYVRTLGLIEMVFTFTIALWGFREVPSKAEVCGIVLLLAAIAIMLNLA